jgi:hypothetical protein
MKIKISVVGIIRIVFGVLSIYPIYGHIQNIMEFIRLYNQANQNILYLFSYIYNGSIVWLYFVTMATYEIIKIVKVIKNDKSN